LVVIIKKYYKIYVFIKSLLSKFDTAKIYQNKQTNKQTNYLLIKIKTLKNDFFCVKTMRREQPKVGRNEPCPCGSGKKFKQCHGKK